MKFSTARFLTPDVLVRAEELGTLDITARNYYDHGIDNLGSEYRVPMTEWGVRKPITQQVVEALKKDWPNDEYDSPRSMIMAHYRSVLALAWVISDQGDRYISVKRAQSEGITSTADMVREALWGERNEEVLDAARKVWADNTVIDELLDCAYKATGDYGDELRTAMMNQYLGRKSLELAASIVGLSARKRVYRGYLAEVGSKVAMVSIKVSTARVLEQSYGPSTLIVGVTAEGKMVKWFASKVVCVLPGDTIMVKSATVKAHEEYRGSDQTVITRARLVTS